MRKIAKEKDFFQVLIILTLAYLYFIFGSIVRRRTLHPLIISTSSFTSFIFFLLGLFLTIAFFYLLGKRLNQETQLFSLIFTFSYSLFPTLIWFFATSLIYFLLPPPRTFSLLGKAFSLFFITFSLILFYWRLILYYLSLRFSLKVAFDKIIFLTLLFLLWFIPYSILIYQLKIFRIPFI